MSSLLPPRKKDWTPGVPQTGFFIRMPEGSVVELVHERASEASVLLFLLATHSKSLSDECIAELRKEASRLGINAATATGRQTERP